ncbi:MAG: hypothetical protein IT384_26555 [Deltaproteobacteria bacterium]|nr:hypothetical protein [Deltaproteobacteria bacterium]
MTTRHFEVVVLGGTTYALATAALLARRGMRGLLVDQGELAAVSGGLLEELVLSEEGSPAMELLHSELGLAHEMRRRARPVTPGLQIVLPDQRFDLPSERGRLVAELQRALGAPMASAAVGFLGELDALDAEAGELLAEIGPLPPQGFFPRRRAAQIAKRHPRLLREWVEPAELTGPKGQLAHLFAGILPFCSHLDPGRDARVSALRFARPLARVLKGLLRIDGGPTMRDVLLECAERNGFTVLRTAAERVEPSGRLVRLALARSTELVTTDCLVDASSDLSGLASIPHKGRARGLAEVLQDATPRGHLHALALELDAAAIPPGMGQQVLLHNGRRDDRPSGGNAESEDRPILLLVRTLAEGRARILALHPISAARAHLEGRSRLDAVMQARIERLIPFAREANLRIEAIGTSSLESNGHAVVHPFFDPEHDALAGVAGVSTHTPYKNVFVAGPAVLPGVGAEAPHLIALEVADAVETALGRARKTGNLSDRLQARNASTPPAAKQA